MLLEWTVTACLFLGLSSAMVAGVFQSFSDFVMQGLVRATPAGGIEAMQQLNRTVFRSVFLATFLALVPASIAYATYAFLNMYGLAQRLIVVASLVYVITVFLVTMRGNVPLNERLDKMDHTSAEAADFWQTYGRVWTHWNTVRTIGSTVTAVCYLFAAVVID